MVVEASLASAAVGEANFVLNHLELRRTVLETLFPNTWNAVDCRVQERHVRGIDISLQDL